MKTQNKNYSSVIKYILPLHGHGSTQVRFGCESRRPIPRQPPSRDPRRKNDNGKLGGGLSKNEMMMNSLLLLGLFPRVICRKRGWIYGFLVSFTHLINVCLLNWWWIMEEVGIRCWVSVATMLSDLCALNLSGLLYFPLSRAIFKHTTFKSRWAFNLTWTKLPLMLFVFWTNYMIISFTWKIENIVQLLTFCKTKLVLINEN